MYSAPCSNVWFTSFLSNHSEFCILSVEHFTVKKKEIAKWIAIVGVETNRDSSKCAKFVSISKNQKYFNGIAISRQIITSNRLILSVFYSQSYNETNSRLNQ